MRLWVRTVGVVDAADLVIYTDGSSLGNPGPGGWAWACELGWASDGAAHTTNNAMELAAIAHALEAAVGAGANEVLVRSDSRYSIDACSKWIHGWRKRGWRTAEGKPVANREIIERVDAAGRLVAVRFEWVPGHAGVSWNERVDDLARRQATAWREGRGRPAGPGLPPGA